MTHPLKIADSTHFRQQHLDKITVLEHASRGLSAIAELLVINVHGNNNASH